MHPLRNGSQATARPAAKPLSGTPGWFTESGENNAPSYPGADWFNHAIAEFLNMLASAGIEFDATKDDHWARALGFFDEKIESHIESPTAHKLGAITREIRSGMESNPVSAEQSMDWHGVFVEEFRKPDDLYDSDVINRALDYIRNLPFTGTKLIFQPRRSYRFAHTCWLTNIHDCHIDLNGATMRRVNGVDTSSTLTTALTVAGGTTFTLAAVPANWRVGDAVTAFTDDTDLHTSQDPRLITDINGNNVTIAGPFSFKADSAGPGVAITTLPVGTRIAKAYQAFSSEPLLAAVNRRVFITNGKFDGNKFNQFNASWRFIPELYLQGNGGLIQDCHFYNMVSETIVGHGFDVVHNVFEDIGGSCYHLSVHDDAIAQSGFGFFTRNTCKRTNLATNAKVGHAEGLITFSWGAGNLIVSDNNCEDGSEGFLGAFSSSVGAMADRLLIASGNIVKRFPFIIAGVTPDVDGVNITGNVFDDCGANDNPENLGPYWLNRRASCNFSGNVLAGNTVAEQWSKSDKLLIGNDKFTGSARLSPTVPAHIKQGISGYNVAIPADIMTVLESDLNAFLAFLTPAGKVSGLAFHTPGGNSAGSALIAWGSTEKVLSLGSNESGGKTTIRAGGYNKKLTAQDDGVQIESMTDGGNQYFYLGDSEVNGTWRFRLTGGNLEFQKRVAGTYQTKSTISGA
ncbi:hypothetical protein SAMN05660691_01059 [Rheinheimera pacifica]|uniref:Uncharacterized protein n=1 Tax=Rheinheimera pacifica TaxID=173990 RepID=A0A1H6KBW1_9GAMM|nr:hypothetical protein [Rheinheimera pacifica]SEH72718.1 hypothetical protein SAMN05660691_01059 [Rheinheimera pacifica]